MAKVMRSGLNPDTGSGGVQFGVVFIGFGKCTMDRLGCRGRQCDRECKPQRCKTRRDNAIHGESPVGAGPYRHVRRK